MRFIVTGSDGFIGKHLVNYLLGSEPGAQVYGFGRHIDLEDLSACHFAFKQVRAVDYIFHLADVSGNFNWSKANAAKQFFSNSRIHLNVLESASTYHRSARFIGVSSLWAYPASTKLAQEALYWSGELLQPTQHYGFSKKLVSSGLQACAQEFGMNGTVFVLSSAYGPGDNSDHIIPTLIRKMTSNLESLVLTSSGHEQRDLIYVDDLVKAIYLHRDFPGTLLNLGSGQHYAIRFVVETLARLINFSGTISYDMSTSGNAMDRLLDLTVARTFSGWPESSSLRSLEEGLRLTINYERKS